jgi:hypothetical protein
MDYGGRGFLGALFFDVLFSCSLGGTQAAPHARLFIDWRVVDERAKVRASPMALARRLLELGS